MSTLFMVQTCTCSGHPSPCFGWEAVSLCIAHLPGMLSFQASGHIDAPRVSHTAPATWRSRRSELSKRYTEEDARKTFFASGIFENSVAFFPPFPPLDLAHPVKVWLFPYKTRISQGILSEAGPGHSVRLV